jgi:hypothetical protein
MRKIYILPVLFCVFACDIYNKPLMEPVSKDPIDSNAVIAIAIACYPYPNVFDVDTEFDAAENPIYATSEYWHDFGLRVTGVTKANETRLLTQEEYTVTGFDRREENAAQAITVTLKDTTMGEYGGITTHFFVAIRAANAASYSIDAFVSHDGRDKIIPFPSSAAANADITVFVYPAANHILNGKIYYKKAKSEQAEKFTIDKLNPDGSFTFKMPPYDIEFYAQFDDTRGKTAMRIIGGGGGTNSYYDSLDKAIYAEGTQGIVTLINDCSVKNSIEIPAGKSIVLTTSAGTAKTVRRSNYNGNLFDIKKTGALTLRTESLSGLVIDGAGSGSTALILAGGMLTMTDRVTLKNNNNTNGAGGVRIDEGGLFEMKGGLITENIVSHGAVRIYENGIFRMSGGTITGNTAYNAVHSVSGVCFEYGVFEMSGSAFLEEGNDIYLSDKKEIKLIGDLSGKTPVAFIKPEAYPLPGSQIPALTGDRLDSSNNGKFAVVDKLDKYTYIIDRNGKIVNASSYYIKSGGDDSKNGLSEDNAFNTLTQALAMANKNIVKTITVVGKLTTDNNGSDTYTNTVFYAKDKGSAVSPITIIGTSSVSGDDAELSAAEMTGNGGRVLYSKNSYLIFKNIKLRGANAREILYGGAGIRVDGGSVTLDTGAEVVDNNNGYSNGKGGGVMLSSGTFSMTGGVIKNNTIVKGVKGTGVYVEGGAFIMGGSSSVEGEVYLESNKKILVSSQLNGGTVTLIEPVTKSNNTVILQGIGGYDLTQEDIDKFKLKDSAKNLILNNDNNQGVIN